MLTHKIFMVFGMGECIEGHIPVAFSDSSVAGGMCHRTGGGGQKHSDTRSLWCQDAIKEREFKLEVIDADLGTKYLEQRIRQALIAMMPLIEKKAGLGLAAMLSAFPSVAEASSSQCAANDVSAQMSIRFVFFFMVCLSVVIGLSIGSTIAPHLKGRWFGGEGNHSHVVAAHEETTARLSREEASSCTQPYTAPDTSRRMGCEKIVRRGRLWRKVNREENH